MENLTHSKISQPVACAEVEPEFRWCRFCKYFLPRGMILNKTKHKTVTLNRDCCEKWRDFAFYPTPVYSARQDDSMCGPDGRDYQECEDHWLALSPELRAIEYYKRGKLYDGSDPEPKPPEPKPPVPKKRSWWKRMLDDFSFCPLIFDDDSEK